MNAIKICNEADINYKTSKNQRLTVELALMQLCSFGNDNFKVEKKKLDILSPAEFKHNQSDSSANLQTKTKSIQPDHVKDSSQKQLKETALVNESLEKKESNQLSDKHNITDKKPEVDDSQTAKENLKANNIAVEGNKAVREIKDASSQDDGSENSLNVKTITEPTIPEKSSIENALNGQSAEDSVVIENSNLSDQKSAYQKNKKPKRRGFSINSALNELNTVKDEVKLDIIEENLPEDDFNSEELLNYWKDYSNQILKDNPVLGHVLQIASPRVESNTLILEFTSKSSIEEFNTIKESFLLKLRTHFNNYSIQAKCIETKSDVKYILSAREQFQELAEKYPAMEDLRRAFDLDIDNPA